MEEREFVNHDGIEKHMHGGSKLRNLLHQLYFLSLNTK